MAFGKRYAGWKARYNSTRGFRRGRGYAGYSKGKVGFGFGKIGVSMDMPFIAGAAIGGCTDLDNAVPLTAKIALACMPVRGLNPVKNFAQGLLIGDAVQVLTGFTGLKTGIGSTSNSTSRIFL